MSNRARTVKPTASRNNWLQREAPQMQGASHQPFPSPRTGTLSTGGQPLSDTVRAPLEIKFRSPLDSVRIHNDPGTARQTRARGASAMSIGEDVFFGAGRFRPHDPAGARLLAHELTHVLQQRPGDSTGSVAAGEAEAHTLARQSAGAAVLPPVQQRIPPLSCRPLRAKAKARAAIEDELDDVFFGIDNTWQAIRQADAGERAALRKDKDLERRIRDRDPAEMDLLKTYLLLTYQTEDKFPAHYRGFIAATDPLGTDEARVYSILRGVTQAERKEMQNMPGLIEVITDEMSGEELHLARRLLYEKEEHQGTGRSRVRSSTRLEKATRYTLDLKARESFSKVSYNMQEAAISPNVDRESLLQDSSLWAQLADEFDPEEVWYLRMVARYGRSRNFPVADTQDESIVGIIWDSVEGPGTKVEKLTKGLHDLNRAKSLRGGAGRALKLPPQEEVKDDPWFVPMLEYELSSGELKEALKAVSATARASAGIRDALETAIDEHDMKEIRKLLTDPKLPAADLASLRNDPVILDEMGEELSGARLAETTQLLHHGSAGIPKLVADLLAFFRKEPIDVAGAVTYMKGLSQADQDRLRKAPGVHFMLTSSDLSFANRAKVLAAIRSHDRKWQEPGSEGIHYTDTARMSTELPVSFTSSEARVNTRLSLDTKAIPKEDGKAFLVDSSTIEDWTRGVDEIWNNRFQVKSGAASLELVFNPYIAHDISRPHVPVFVHKGSGRARAAYTGMYIFLEGLPSQSETPPSTFAHELGHVLGNPDEYALTPSEYRKFAGTKGTQPPPRGGETVKGLMGSQYESTAVKKRHAGPALDIINRVRDKAKYPAPFKLVKK